MAQQRYIYPPSVIEGAEALYNDPSLGDGFTTISQELLRYNLTMDRSIEDIIKLPLGSKQLELAPNELASSNSIYNIIDGLHQNFLYLNTRTSLVSNVLPGKFKGYYTNNGDEAGLPIFKENTDTVTTYVPPTAVDTGGNPDILTTAPSVSTTINGEYLNELVTGTWVRDNTSITRDILTVADETWQYGFLGSKTHMTIVKMSSKPTNQITSNYDENGNLDPSGGWTVLTSYNMVEELPSVTNTLYYNNITSIKSSKSKKIYVLDQGLDQLGVTNISTSSQRSVIYRYDMTGYLNQEITNHVQYNKRLLVNTLGDLNTVTNESDTVNPVAFTVKPDDSLIVYDEYDYTFKEFDDKNSFIRKFPKRNILFRGAKGSNKQYTGVADIHYDEFNDKLYILTPAGMVMCLDNEYKLVDSFKIPKDTSNQGVGLTSTDIELPFYKTDKSGDTKHEVFKSFEFSQNEDNIYYVLTSNRIIKRFKSRNDINVGVFNLLDVGIGMYGHQLTGQAYRASPKFMSMFQEAYVQIKQFTDDAGEIIYRVDTDRSYTYDQIFIYTDFVDVKSNITREPPTSMGLHYLLSFQERINTRSNLSDSDFPIYYISDTSSLTFKEYNSDFVYNKLMYKLLSNHLWLINKLSYKIAAKYTPSGTLVFDRREYILERQYRSLLVDLNDPGFYVGINEYFSTAIFNRCFKKIIDIQTRIAEVLNTTKNNKWPSVKMNIPVEPYLYTSGTTFKDLDKVPYTGYYYIYEQPQQDIYVSGRDVTDGSQLADGSPASERYLTVLDT
jgi:hypothetical protein